MIPKSSIPVFVYPAAVLSMLFWGMSFVWSTQVLEYYSPITTILLRLLISSVLLFLLLKPFGLIENIRKEHLGLFLLSALFNPFLYFIGENYGLKLTTPTVSAVVIATIPVLTPVFAYFLLKEKLTIFNYIGIMLSFAGVVIMLMGKDLTLDVSAVGLGFLFFAVITGIIYSVLLKKLTVHYNALTIITWQNILGFIYMLPVFLIMDVSTFLEIKPGPGAIRSLILLAVFASSGAFILYTIAIKYLGVNKSNVYTNLIPVITAIFSFYIIQEEFTMNKLAGILVVVGGVFLSQIRSRNKQIIK
ncbi:MAG: DMT family transporter [Bacteroidetes bacterium]|nr:DMT family transporter [Bacteroidota bacterium]